MNLRETLGYLGALAIATSPVTSTTTYISLNSTAKHVQTSQGNVLVRNWQNSRSTEVSRGFTTLSDVNHDGRADTKRGDTMGKFGVYRWAEQPTEEDIKLYTEAISKSEF